MFVFCCFCFFFCVSYNVCQLLLYRGYQFLCFPTTMGIGEFFLFFLMFPESAYFFFITQSLLGITFKELIQYVTARQLITTDLWIIHQVIQSGIASLKSRVTPYLPVEDLVSYSQQGDGKAAAGLQMLGRSGNPDSFQGTEKLLKKIWGERMSRVFHFFVSVCFASHIHIFFFFFCCPALYLCESSTFALQKLPACNCEDPTG